MIVNGSVAKLMPYRARRIGFLSRNAGLTRSCRGRRCLETLEVGSNPGQKENKRKGKLRKKMREKKLKTGFDYDEKEDIAIVRRKRRYTVWRDFPTATLFTAACRGCAHQGTLCKIKQPSIKKSCDCRAELEGTVS